MGLLLLWDFAWLGADLRDWLGPEGYFFRLPRVRSLHMQLSTIDSTFGCIGGRRCDRRCLHRRRGTL